MELHGRPGIVTIGVNYETDGLALRFVRGAAAASRCASMQIVLVDNSERCSSKQLFDLIRAENPDVLCVKPPRNLGYFGGAAYGLQHCTGVMQGSDWVMVANVDVSFSDRHFFFKLGAFRQTGDVGVIAPSIQSSITLHDQNPMMLNRPTRVRMRFYQLLHRSYYLVCVYELLAAAYHLLRSTIRSSLRWRPMNPQAASARASSGIDQPSGGRVQIYAPHGACMIFSNEFFSRGGSLEVPFFLYGEEIYVAETTRRLGLQVLYDPSLRLQHDEHQSTGLGNVLLSREAARHLSETTDYLVNTYFS